MIVADFGALSISQQKGSFFQFFLMNSSERFRYFATHEREIVPGGKVLATLKVIAMIRHTHLNFSESPTQDIVAESSSHSFSMSFVIMNLTSVTVEKCPLFATNAVDTVM